MIKFFSILSLFLIFNINNIFANPNKDQKPLKKKRKVVIIQKIIRRNTKSAILVDKKDDLQDIIKQKEEEEKKKKEEEEKKKKEEEEKKKKEEEEKKKKEEEEKKKKEEEEEKNNNIVDNKLVYFDVSAGFGFYGYGASLYQDKTTTNGIFISTNRTKILDLTSSAFGFNGSVALGVRLYKEYIRGEIETSFFQIISQSLQTNSSLSVSNFPSVNSMIGLASNFYTDLSINKKFFISLGLGMGGYYSELQKKIIPGFSGIVAFNFKLNNNLIIYIKYKAIIFDGQSLSLNESQIYQTIQTGNNVYYAKTPVTVMHFALIGLRYYFW